MPNFLARVELLDIKATDDTRQLYEDLHRYMEFQGFQRTLRFVSGAKQLPTGTYYGTFSGTAVDAVNKAKTAAAQTKKKAMVVACEANSTAASGLESA